MIAMVKGVALCHGISVDFDAFLYHRGREGRFFSAL